ncbi:hypothetical protein QO004_005119 [Rhizobium mesoamericanum]|nr:hypothetical protein [Rhizobium mesoamericanum]
MNLRRIDLIQFIEVSYRRSACLAVVAGQLPLQFVRDLLFDSLALLRRHRLHIVLCQPESLEYLAANPLRRSLVGEISELRDDAS